MVPPTLTHQSKEEERIIQKIEKLHFPLRRIIRKSPKHEYFAEVLGNFPKK